MAFNIRTGGIAWPPASTGLKRKLDDAASPRDPGGPEGPAKRAAPTPLQLTALTPTVLPRLFVIPPCGSTPTVTGFRVLKIDSLPISSVSSSSSDSTSTSLSMDMSISPPPTPPASLSPLTIPMPTTPVSRVPDVVRRAFESLPNPLDDDQIEGVYEAFRTRTTAEGDRAVLDSKVTGAARTILVGPDGQGYALMNCEEDGDEPINNGGYKVVYHGVGLHDGRHYAIGVCNIPTAAQAHGSTEERVGDQLDQEAAFDMDVHGAPFIMETPLVIPDNRDDPNYYFVMKYCEKGTLFDLLEKLQQGSLTLSLRKRVVLSLQILQGILEAHKKGIIHRDLKPENILLDEFGRPRIADFGLSARIDDAEALKKIVGTPDFVAPEVARGKPSTPKYDSWSAGVILYNLLALRRLPWENYDGDVLPQIPQDRGWQPPLRFHFGVAQGEQEKAVKELLCLILKVDPNDRISIEEAIDRLSAIEKSLIPRPSVVSVAPRTSDQPGTAPAPQMSGIPLSLWSQQEKDLYAETLLQLAGGVA